MNIKYVKKKYWINRNLIIYKQINTYIFWYQFLFYSVLLIIYEAVKATLKNKHI